MYSCLDQTGATGGRLGPQESEQAGEAIKNLVFSSSKQNDVLSLKRGSTFLPDCRTRVLC